MQAEHFLWRERYRPRTIAECILPDDLKNTFQQFVDQENIPDLILSGSSGVGKTTIARAMLDQLGCDYIVINGSLNGNIDTLRNDILSFASAISFTGSRKYVILDEADGLNPNSMQPALRNFMEEYSKNCGFILTCNKKNSIIPALHSRCAVIDFKFSKKEKSQLASQFFKRIVSILKENNIQYDKEVIANVIMKYYPDFRRVLNELQRYSASGRIDSGILVNLSQVAISALVNLIKEKNFTEIRKWTAENVDNDANSLYRMLYDTADHFVVKSSIPQLVLILAKYQYQASFAADAELNLLACLTEIMVDVEFN